MVKLFGWEIRRPSDVEEDRPSFAPKIEEDGATIVTSAGGFYGTYVDLQGTIRTESELVSRYREMSLQPEIEEALEDIINEAMDTDDNQIVTINLDKIKYSETVKKQIRNEFDNILNLLNFNQLSYEIFRRWYIDGRLYFHVIIDTEKPGEGIKELRYLDPRKIKKIREVVKVREGEITVTKTKNEYYMYNDYGFTPNPNATRSSVDVSSSQSSSGIKIAKDAIIYVTSGIMDQNNTMVLSYLHKAIRPLNMLRSLEDANVIYVLSRAPERRIFYIDVGSLPKAKAEQYVRDMMTKHKNRLVYDANTGEIKDDRKYMCYALNTKIPLLDGRTLELNEIIKEYNEGKKNWVYSCDPKTGKFYPGPISWAGITKNESDVVKVTFDNGKSVVCTPDHKFPVWGKGFVEAQHLTTEDSIIPGYRRKSVIYGDAEYEQIYKNDTKKWEFTHREITNWKKDVGLNEEFIYDSKYKNSRKNVVHHKNFDRNNNNPENLIMMNHKDHMIYHKEIQSLLYNDDMIQSVLDLTQNRLKKSEIIESLNDDQEMIDEWIRINKDRNPKNRDVNSLIFGGKDLARISKILGYESWKKMALHFEFENDMRENSGRRIRSRFKKGSNELSEHLSMMAKKRIPSCKTWKIITPNGDTEIIENLNDFCRKHNLNRSNIKGKSGSKGFKAEQLVNHKIISVEKLEEKITVGSMSIDADETYHSHHTYLLDAGVYTKNTMLEDYWLPRREGSRGTEITTLPGSGSLMQNDTIEYFQNKLYRSLNIPITRLQAEGGFSLGRASEVSRDEVKFGKFIGRLRRRFSHLFYQALERQLILKKIATPREWEKIKSEMFFEYAIDNYFSELKYNEILVGRLDTLSRLENYIGKYYSDRWVRKNILMQTDEDIADMDKEIQGEGGDSDDDFDETPDDKDNVMSSKQNDQTKNIMLNDSNRFDK